MAVNLSRLSVNQQGFGDHLKQLLNRGTQSLQADMELQSTVAEIIQQVRERGDAAVCDYTKRFDQHQLTSDQLEVAPQRIETAYANLDKQQQQSLEFAAQRIRDYHQRQLQQDWQFEEADGTRLGQRILPLSRAGLYVPGGKAAYPSSVLMNAIPAKVAGVKELIMVTPAPQGELNDMVLAAAKIAGVDRVFCIGGAQAIAALAFGTESVPAVDKITGPGNIYVATAKKLVFGQVGIDMIAGPSEVLVIADDSVDPRWVAMDMFAQAEHDEQAQAILLTRHAEFAISVEQAINDLIESMPRRPIIEKSLASNGAIILADSDQQLVEVANLIAAEHLEIFTYNSAELAGQIEHAGAIFVGPFSAESLGDYCAGPNHVLPTSGTARFSSPLGVADFQKRTSMIEISAKGAETIGRHAAVLAHGESLTAHARSAEYRFAESDLNNKNS